MQIVRLPILPNFEVGNQETHNKIEYVYTGPRVRPTSRAYSDADPGFVCPIAAAAAAAAAVATAATSAAAGANDFPPLKIMNPNVTDTYNRARRCSFVLVQHNT